MRTVSKRRVLVVFISTPPLKVKYKHSKTRSLGLGEIDVAYSPRVHIQRFWSAKKVPHENTRVLLHFGIDPVHDVGRTHRAGLTRDLAPLPEQDQRRDAADAELRAYARRLLGVELGAPQPRLQLRRGLLEGRRHHFAGPTPRGSEILEHRVVVVCNVFV